MKINTYLIKSKAAFIKEARDDFLDIYGINLTPFTRKIYFYFFIHDNKKYIHKRALWFVYTNADTYTKEVDPWFCYLSKQTDPTDIYPFLESYQGTLLPQLLESNDKFLVYDYFDGDPIESITDDEFFKLKAHHEQMTLTPFYNSMTYNLVRADNDIKLIDFKHFEPKDDKPFFVYLYNEENGVNILYIEIGTDTQDIFNHLSIDYPVDSAIIKIIERNYDW